RHFRIEKRVEEGRTRVEARLLPASERIDELARMLGGKTETATQHARELLAVGGRKGAPKRARKAAPLPEDEPGPLLSATEPRLLEPVPSRTRTRRRA